MLKINWIECMLKICMFINLMKNVLIFHEIMYLNTIVQKENLNIE